MSRGILAITVFIPRKSVNLPKKLKDLGKITRNFVLERLKIRRLHLKSIQNSCNAKPIHFNF